MINLIQNSAKVMATSGLVCLKFIIQNTFSPRSEQSGQSTSQLS